MRLHWFRDASHSCTQLCIARTETAVDNSKTIVMMSRQHGDRWSSFGAHAGIVSISKLLRPDQLREIEILQEFDDAFLLEISPDITLARWEAEATVFEAGSYIDLAFFVVDGEV